MTRSASVIIPSYAGARRLPRLLDALAKQTYPDWEAIVVIDGDTDGSEAVVKRYGNLPVRCIVLPENRGRVTALNTGFEAADGDILIRCDDDFEPDPDHIAAHCSAHEGEARGVIGLPRNIAPENAYMRAYGADADLRSRAAAYAASSTDRWRFWGGNTSIPRAIWQAVGPFDTSYRGYGWEDVDYGFRVHLSGFPIVMVPEGEVRHHLASVNARLRAERAFWSGQARHHFENLHASAFSGRSSRPEPSVWNSIVRLTANQLSYERTQRCGKLVDQALPYLPRALGRKAVALVVEAASMAGYAQPTGATHDF